MFLHFYPRPPGGGRRHSNGVGWNKYNISIHALRVEGDIGTGLLEQHSYEISIHALRVEGDRKNPQNLAYTYYISIHALRVEGDCLTAS